MTRRHVFTHAIRLAIGLVDALCGAILITFNPRWMALMRRNYERKRLAAA